MPIVWSRAVIPMDLSIICHFQTLREKCRARWAADLHHVAGLMVEALHSAGEARRDLHCRLVAGHLAQLLELLDLISDCHAPSVQLALLDACEIRAP